MRISSDALRKSGCPGDDVELAAVVAWLKSQQLDCMEDLKYVKDLTDLDGKCARGLSVRLDLCSCARRKLSFQKDFGIHRGVKSRWPVGRPGVQEKEKWVLSLC